MHNGGGVGQQLQWANVLVKVGAAHRCNVFALQQLVVPPVHIFNIIRVLNGVPHFHAVKVEVFQIHVEPAHRAKRVIDGDGGPSLPARRQHRVIVLYGF